MPLIPLEKRTRSHYAECDSCSRQLSRETAYVINASTDFDDHLYLCYSCRWDRRNDDNGVALRSYGTCDCFQCRQLPNRGGYRRTAPFGGDLFWCTTDRALYLPECHDCDNHPRVASVHDYGYTPSLAFHGVEGDPDLADETGGSTDGLFLGIEIEVESRDIQSAMTVMYDLEQSKQFYAKHDSSIDEGFEAVSHPMTLSAWDKVADWDALRDMFNEGECEVNDGVGMHVHVSRSGFRDTLHTFLWVAFWHSNETPLSALAQRNPHSWGKFPRYDPGYIASKAREGWFGALFSDRYQVINTEPEHTFEVRMFKSSVDIDVIKANIQLVHSTVKYTESLSSNDYTDGNMTWAGFIEFLSRHGGTYAELIALMARLNTWSDTFNPARTSSELHEIIAYVLGGGEAPNHDVYDDYTDDRCLCGECECTEEYHISFF